MYANTAVSQDACKGATLTLALDDLVVSNEEQGHGDRDGGQATVIPDRSRLISQIATTLGQLGRTSD